MELPDYAERGADGIVRVRTAAQALAVSECLTDDEDVVVTDREESRKLAGLLRGFRL